MTAPHARVHVVEEEVVDANADGSIDYRASLERSARAGAMEASASSLGLAGPLAISKRMGKLREEAQVQIGTIVAQKMKTDAALHAVADIGRTAADEFSDAVADISAAKKRHGEGEYQGLVAEFCDHGARATGNDMAKLAAGARGVIASAVPRDVYVAPSEPTLLERIGLQ